SSDLNSEIPLLGSSKFYRQAAGKLVGGAMSARTQISRLLAQRRAGQRDVESELIRRVYPELRRLAQHYMRRERHNHTLQATALVHEAYMRMVGDEKPVWQDRAHFFALAATQMRRILVDHARAAN